MVLWPPLIESHLRGSRPCCGRMIALGARNAELRSVWATRRPARPAQSRWLGRRRFSWMLLAHGGDRHCPCFLLGNGFTDAAREKPRAGSSLGGIAAFGSASTGSQGCARSTPANNQRRWPRDAQKIARGRQASRRPGTKAATYVTGFTNGRAIFFCGPTCQPGSGRSVAASTLHLASLDSWSTAYAAWAVLIGCPALSPRSLIAEPKGRNYPGH